MASRARNKLNIKQVASFSQDGIYSDGGGLYLRIRNGRRRWIFVGTLNHKRFEMALGPAEDVPLARARELAFEARKHILEGRNPKEERDAARGVAKADEKKVDVVTFGQFAGNLVADLEDGFKNPKHRQQWRNTLATYAAPIADVPIAEVNTDQLLDILKPIWLTKMETASRLRGRIERVLDAAKAKGLRSGENPARLRGHLALLLPKQKKVVRHHPALPFTEIAEFMRQLRKRPGAAARALEFTIYTAARSGETRGMTWAEVDLQSCLWTVPATRMKAGSSHQVPLSKPAVQVLEAMREDGLEPDDVVFPAPRGGTLSDMALAAVLRRMGRPDITVHGFRSTFRDWAGDATEFRREEVELALAHTIASSTERAYRRATALDKRRRLMDAWGDYCSGGSDEKEAGVATPPPHDAMGDV